MMPRAAGLDPRVTWSEVQPEVRAHVTRLGAAPAQVCTRLRRLVLRVWELVWRMTGL